MISARNCITGKVINIREGMVNAEVVLDIGNNNKVTSVITMDSLRELNVKVGDSINAVIKSSNVMLMN